MSSPPPIFTDSPRQHPNLIIGALHLLSWRIFHPKAYIHHLNTLYSDYSSSRKKNYFRFFLQSQIVLPILAAFIAGCGNLLFGVPINCVLVGVAGGVTFGVLCSLARNIIDEVEYEMDAPTLYSMTIAVTFCMGFSVVGGMTIAVVSGVGFVVATAVVDFARGDEASDNNFAVALLVSLIFMLAVAGVVVYGVAVVDIDMTDVMAGAIEFGVGFGVVIAEWLSKASRHGSIMSDFGAMLLLAVPSGMLVAIAGGVAFFAMANRMAFAVEGSVLVAVGVILIFILTYAATILFVGEILTALGNVSSIVWLSTGFTAAASVVVLIVVTARLDWANAVIFTVGFDVGFAVVLLVGLTIDIWLPFAIYPLIQAWNTLLYRLDRLPHNRQKIFLHWHSVGWYEGEHLPLTGLDKHLILAIEKNITLSIEAINYVSTTKQQWAVQAAQIELDARTLKSCQTIDAITQLPSDWGESSLNNPVTDLFRIFNRIIRDTQAACTQQSNYNQRLVLKAIEERIDGELVGLKRSSDKYAVRFRPILEQWRQIVADYIEAQHQACELNQEIASPYVVGIPLTTNAKMFAGRQDLGSRLERLILDVRRPPLLLYGQRRMGKTSLLNNLNRLLPSTIIPLFVDLQGGAAAANHLDGFFYALAKDLRTAASDREIALPPVELADFQTEPIIQFNDWLDTLETALGMNIGLLVLDEFEALDKAFQRQSLDPDDVLGWLRRTIQHRPKFKVLIAGSHTLAEYQRWSSYLINVQTLHISYLKESEAIQLIERPIPDFPLHYEPAALDLVLHLTRCHPYFVQLLCEEIVALKNDREPSERLLATSTDVEAAVPEALKSGSAGFFGDLQTNQVDKLGREILIYLAHQGDGAIISCDLLTQQFDTDLIPSLNILLQRELIEEEDGGYKFAIELIRRWFLRAT